MLVGKKIGPFHIERELGYGAMGTVFRALNCETGQRVALKMIADILLSQETAVKRFEREASILKQLKHPNIVRLIGTGRYKKKTPFFIMEYVEGESLDVILERRSSAARQNLRERDGRFPWDEVVHLGKQLCDALQHAHQKGIIHRDLKPSNLMILADGTLKLTDFGIAKDVDVTALTAQNVTVGTAAYMSPEQCRGEKNLSHKSDLYSLGCVFYELLTGRKPFQKDNPIDMFLAHVNDTPQRPREQVMDIPVWLDTLVTQLMEKKPEHRPFDAAMVHKVLDEVEKKSQAQHSAAVDAATARAVNQLPNRSPADEADREAARMLRGAVMRKKVRKKAVPLLERRPVQAVGLLAALVALGGFIFYMTRPVSAEQLYARVKAAAEAKDEDRLLQDGQRYLDQFGSRDDEPARQVRAWWESAWIDRRERQLHNKSTSKFLNRPEDEGEKIAFEALKFENEGDVKEAGQRWVALDQAYKDELDGDKRAYSLVARRKIQELADLDRRGDRLLANINQFRIGKSPDRPATDDSERRMEEAVRYEDFGDLPAARDRYLRFYEANVKERGPRIWVVFAAWRHRDVKARAVIGVDKERAFREDLLKRRLTAIRDVPPTADPSQRRVAERIARDLVDLYGRDPVPEFAETSRLARAKLPDLIR